MYNFVADVGNASPPIVHRLSVLGGCGLIANDRKIHSDLMRLVSKCGFDELLTASTFRENVHCMLPSTIIKLLHAKAPYHFRSKLGGRRDAIRAFWEGLFASPRGRALRRKRPFLRGKSAADLETTIPCRLHSDAAPFSKAKGVLELCWSSLLATGDPDQNRFLIRSHLKLKGDAPEPEWAMILEDFEKLQDGVVSDEDGTSWGACLLFGQGDLDELCNEYGMQHFSGSDEMCMLCRGNRSSMPFTDLRDNAKWHATECLPNSEYLGRVRTPHHPLIDTGFFDREFFRIDVMHVSDLNGLASIVVASIMMRLVRSESRLGNNQVSRSRNIIISDEGRCY